MQDKNMPVIPKPLDHTKKYFRVNGYEVTASFTKERRPEMFEAFISHRDDRNEDGTRRFSKAERRLIDEAAQAEKNTDK